MKKYLYICSTYYHVLVACLKSLSTNNHADIIITGYIPDYFKLTERIKKSGLFNDVFCEDLLSEFCKNKLNKLFYKSGLKRIVKKNSKVDYYSYFKIPKRYLIIFR